MKKLMLISFPLVLATLTFCIFFTSSANISDYSTYFISDNEKSLAIGEIRVTSFGTTTLLLDDGETQILIDGFVSRASLVKSLTAKLQTDKTLVNTLINEYEMERLAAVFVSHSHYDHVLDAPYFAKQTHAKLYGSPSTLNVGLGSGLAEQQLSEINFEIPVQVGKFTVTAIPSKHSDPTIFNDDIGEEITRPLAQPARAKDFKEGTSIDFLIEYKGKRILVKPSFHYIENQFNDTQADVLFLGIARLGKANPVSQDLFYKETVRKIRPQLIIPIHWDNFFKPLDQPLQAQYKIGDNLENGLDYLINRTKEDHISVKLLDGYSSIVLFGE